jgi:peptidoglycan/LPS O-acetylase OafA/YrhL
LSRNDGREQAILPESAERYYFPELDTLRFFAFLVVFFFHASLLLPRTSPKVVSDLYKVFDAGFFGVDLFFALSAYLITQLLTREQTRTGAVDIRSFYVRRALRIWPLYFFFLFAAYLPSHWFHRLQIGNFYLTSSFFFVANFAGIFLGYYPTWVAHLWSISVEEQFYLIWPWAVRKTFARGLPWIAGALFVFSVLARVAACELGASWQAIAFGTFTRLDPIAAGIALAIVPRDWLLKFGSTSRVSVALAGVMSWLLVVYFFPVINLTPTMLNTSVGYPLVALGCTAFMVATLNSGARFLVNRWLIYLGRISYGLYVYHWPTLGLVNLYFQLVFGGGGPQARPLWMAQAFYLLVSFFLTFFIATASYRWLEAPFLRLKSRFTYVESRPV